MQMLAVRVADIDKKLSNAHSQMVPAGACGAGMAKYTVRSGVKAIIDDSLKSTPCSKCGKTVTWKKPPKSADRLPHGWKRRAGETYCRECWRESFILRAVTVPVASPLDCNWDELNLALREMWSASTSASNWILTELYARDARRRPGDEKLPAMPAVYLYPELRGLFPSLPSQSVAALEQAVKRKYLAKRYEVVWTHASSLPTYRYPTPFGIPNQGWSVDIEDERPIVSIRVGDRRLRLRLQSGHRFQRQMAAIRQIVAGAAEQGQMDISRKGRGKNSEIMVKMVAWLPRKVSTGIKDGTLVVRSTPEAILQAFNAKDEALWTYHGDHLRRWIAEHTKRLQRLADDSKAELRPVPPFAEYRRKMVTRYHQRMTTAAHQISAWLVGYARRRKFAAIQYDDSDHSYGEGLPWADLRLKVAEKADAAGITFTLASAPVSPETPEPLAKT